MTPEERADEVWQEAHDVWGDHEGKPLTVADAAAAAVIASAIREAIEDERESCAVLCELFEDEPVPGRRFADAIRARGEKP